MPRITADQAGGANRCAFLDMIAASDTGAALLPLTDDGYNVIVGSTAQHLILFPTLGDGSPDYSKHPDEFEAEEDSTAAGRYQEKYSNWVAYSKMLGLSDFGPVSQDLIALQQIREARALPLIDAGKLNAAIALCAHLWASFPGADYGQHENKLADLQAAYTQAGGTLA